MPVRIPSNTNKPQRPEGALPRNLQFVVVGGIAAVILIATFWSGNKPAKPEQRGPVAGPAANQVESFRLALEKERRDEAAANVDRLSSLAHAANGGFRHQRSSPQAVRPVREPNEAIRHQRQRP